MSGRSIARYFPWCRVKIAYQNVNQESRDLDYFALKVKQAFPGRESSN